MDPNKRFEENMSLVGFIFQKHFKNPEYAKHHDDLMQEGYIALWRSCCQFNESLGFQFSTYAGNAIRYAMQNYLKKENKVCDRLVSIDTVIAEDGEGSEICLIDTLFVMPEDRSIENLVEFCISLMEEFDQHVVRVLLENHTQIETASICNTSQASVSRCLAKLRKIILEELKK